MRRRKSGLTRRPSSWWTVLGALCAALTIASGAAAVVVQRDARKPVGEGEVFVADAAVAAARVVEIGDADLAVRTARNELSVEAISVLSAQGMVVASTSETLIGQAIDHPLIASGVSERRFTALAAPVDWDLWLDEVVLWPAGTILYQVVSPMETGDSLLIHYDVSELLSRRTPPGGIDPLTIQLFGLAAIFGVIGAAILVGHARAVRRHRRVQMESEALRRKSVELQRANTSLERARRQAEEALALAEEKIRIRSEFVLMINHELRTPLTSIVTGAELLRTTALTPTDRRALLDSMVADGSRLQEIIAQILAVARIENRGLSYELAEVSFSELCQALTTAHQGALADLPADPSPDVWVRTDLGALNLMLASLVDNAFTHGAGSVILGCSTASQVKAQHEVGERPEDAVYVTVADDGPGIDPTFLPRIFEKFEKSSFSPGTGLGLYLARMIVGALDGSLAVATSPSGTVFQIALPMAPMLARVEALT